MIKTIEAKRAYSRGYHHGANGTAKNCREKPHLVIYWFRGYGARCTTILKQHVK
jgi:hypothetical protein